VEAARISNSRRTPPTDKKPAKIPEAETFPEYVKGVEKEAILNPIKMPLPATQSPSDLVKAAGQGNSFTARENLIKRALPTRQSPSDLVEAEDYQFEQNFDYNGHFPDEEIHEVGNDDNDQFEQNFDYNGHFADEEIQEYEIDKKPY
jgi:hypothetical protein